MKDYKGSHLKLVYKKGSEEEENELNAVYKKKMDEVRSMRIDTNKVIEIIRHPKRYFRDF